MKEPRKPTFTQIELAARVAHEAQYIERGDRYATEEEMNMHRDDPLANDSLVWHIIAPAFGMTIDELRDHMRKVWRVRWRV